MTPVHPIALPRPCAAHLPSRIEPMLAVAGDLPLDSENWAFEYKWDGVRCMAFWDGSNIRLLSRNHIVITQRYPELANFGASLGRKPAVLDGEIIALDRAGRPSFPQLQLRMHVDNPPAALIRQTPVWYVVFDVLYADGRSVMDEPYTERRRRLEDLVRKGPHWHLSPSHVGDGPAMLETARRNAMEGVVAKSLTGTYVPGRRSSLWRKTKIIFGQELVIGGWIPEAGQRADRVGALLLGYYDPASKDDDAAFHYAGRVGTGFTDATQARLVSLLKDISIGSSPFKEKVARANTIFVKPTLVAEVEYRRWPDGGLIQQAAFKGLRTDKPAQKVVKEPKTKGAS